MIALLLTMGLFRGILWVFSVFCLALKHLLADLMEFSLNHLNANIVHGHDVLHVTLWKDYNDGLSYVVNFSFRFSLLLEGLSTNSGESLKLIV